MLNKPNNFSSKLLQGSDFVFDRKRRKTCPEVERNWGMRVGRTTEHSGFSGNQTQFGTAGGFIVGLVHFTPHPGGAERAGSQEKRVKLPSPPQLRGVKYRKDGPMCFRNFWSSCFWFCVLSVRKKGNGLLLVGTCEGNFSWDSPRSHIKTTEMSQWIQSWH